MHWLQASTRRGHAIGVAVAVMALSSGVAVADTIHVPGDYPTIQAGIDAASDGDEVVVADGTWTGNGNRDIEFLGTSITVRSASGDPTACIIDCAQQGRGFRVAGVSTARIEGFTIRNGKPEADHGGAVYCVGSGLTMEDCIVVDNEATRGASGSGECYGGNPGYDGGGVYCVNSTLLMSGCVVEGNRAGRGSGCYCLYESCAGGSGGEGGGLSGHDATITLVSCTIRGNRAGDGGGAAANFGYGGRGGPGGGVFCRSCDVSVINCRVEGNHAGSGGGGSYPSYGGDGGPGGGIAFTDESSVTIAGCQLTENRAGAGAGGEPPGDDGDGGGLYGIEAVDFATYLVNSTVAANRVGERGRGSGVAILGADYFPAGVRNCIVWDNTLYTLNGEFLVSYSCVEGGHSGQGNIDIDPKFALPVNGDYHLLPISPCIDAGDNVAVPDGITEDLDGNPRFVDDPDTEDTGHGDPPIVDMGAYEFQILCPADLDGLGAVDFGDILRVLSAWGNAGGPEDLDGSGIVDFGDLLVVLASWGPCLHPYMGACCFLDGACTDATVEADCLASGGLYRGDGSACAEMCVGGACCFGDGTCNDDVIAEACEAMDGAYRGDGSTCAATCLGACCFDDRTCEEATVESECASEGGLYAGDGSTCAATCLGACCFNDGTCQEATIESQCASEGGLYAGAGSTCAGQGACCFDSGGCLEIYACECVVFGGLYRGDGTTCAADCPGACCFQDGTCSEATEESECVASGGLYRGGGSRCTADCRTGACCLIESCIVTVSEFCAAMGGTYRGDDTTCATSCNLSRDDCSDAVVFGDGEYFYSNITATTDGPDLPPECDEGGGLGFEKDVWFGYQASCDGTATASVCESNFRTRLAIYDDGDCPGPIIACNDDACGVAGTRSEVSFTVETGGVYVVRIGSASGSIGSGTLVLSCDP